MAFRDIGSIFTLSSSHHGAREPDDDADEDYIDLLEKIESILVTYVLGFLILFGIVGNVFSVITMQTKYFRQYRSMFVLCALGLADIGVLLTSALYVWVSVVTDYEVDYALNSTGSCKMLYFFCDFFLLLSAWTLVLVTIERMITVIKPYKVHVLCSKTRMVIAWVIVVFLLVIMDLYIVILFDMYDYSEIEDHGTNGTNIHCDFPPENVELLYDVHFVLSLVMGSVVPSICIIVFNGVIIYKLSKTPKDEAAVLAEGGARKGRSITIMLVAVSAVFLICTLPLRLLELCADQWFPNHRTDKVADAEYRVTSTCLGILYFTNNAINFILYVAIGSRFRRAFKELFCPCCKKPSADITHVEAESISFTVEKTELDSSMTPPTETYTTITDNF